MLWLNRTLNILLLIFAVVSLIFGYMLFERRKGLRLRGEKLADTVSEVAKIMDENSGTQLQKDVHRRELTTDDGKTISGGTLGWSYFQESYDSESQSYTNYEGTLEKVRKQALDLREQRDALATTLADIAKLFGQDGTDASTYQNLTQFQNAKKLLLENLEKIQKRDDAIILKIDEIAKKTDTPIDINALADTEKFDEPLTKLGIGVTKLKERMVNFADTLSQAVAKIDSHDFEADADMLDDETEYVGQLTAILNDFASINDKLQDYEKYKVEFLETKDTLEKTRIALESTHDNFATLENKLANLETEYTSLRTRYNRLVGDTSQKEDRQLQKLEGNIIEVDYDWNYVVLDLGSKDSLPENLEMTVAREQEYICKVLVTKVYKNYAVAEILPKLKEGNVIQGDRVIF